MTRLGPYARSTRALLVLLLAGGCVPDASRSDRTDATLLQLVAAEDARPEAGAGLDRLIEATADGDAGLRRVAVRGLGRLERPSLLPRISPLLRDPSPTVRASAANAVAQAVFTSDGSDAASLLLPRLEQEPDATVRGALARSLGRLTLPDRQRRTVADALVDASRDGDADAPAETVLGVAHGLEALVRGARDRPIASSVERRLDELSRFPDRSLDDITARRVRRLALLALGQGGLLRGVHVDTALRDDDMQMGAFAVRFLGSLPVGQRAEFLRRAVASNSLLTVVEALRHLGGAPRTANSCEYLLAAAAATTPAGRELPVPIRVLALDALATPCPDRDAQSGRLLDAATGPIDGPMWQPAAHGLLALAQLQPDEARPLLPRYLNSPNGFVRGYAARTADVLGDVEVLRSLSTDEDPNVRTIAIDALFDREGHALDSVLIRQLDQDDPQLLMTASRLLEGTRRPVATAEAVMGAFERISAAGRDTWRDSRRALLDRLVTVGDASMTARLTPWLGDYDPVVADDVAAILERWNGRPFVGAPVAGTGEGSIPSLEELSRMRESTLRLHMETGGVIEIELDPDLAPTNVTRLARLANDGYFDGLTFHRWAPNFVIQGGSPGANEYQGDGPFTRDEVGLLPHWRGTVGISTRGHDTGDGQIFVNLMDNVRLDHAYTIVGTVVSGMDVVDRVVEGAVIERAEVTPDR